MAELVLPVVETDLKLLAAEAKKAESPMNVMGIFHHSELPALKEATERALHKVAEMHKAGHLDGGLASVQRALEILTPFALACETKYPKLACIALSSFQKLLANDAVSVKGRCEIIKAFQSAEKLSDESVKLRILQASLTIIQSPSFADEQDGIQQLLSVLFRLYVNNKSNLAVHSTAGATIRQAVALIFDHSVIKGRAVSASAAVGPSSTPPIGSPAVSSSPLLLAASTPIRSAALSSLGGTGSPGAPGSAGGSAAIMLGDRSRGGSMGGAPSGVAAAMAAASAAASAASAATAGGGGTDGGAPLGRELVPVLLLEEVVAWLGGAKPDTPWISLGARGPRPDRSFLLELLEGVLLQRAPAIHRLPGLALAVRVKVAPVVCGLLDSACDRLVDPADAPDCRLVVRCAAALVRRHHALAPERAAYVLVRLAETAGSVGRQGAAHRWQRFMALQALRPLLGEPQLVYRLYHLNAAASSGGGGLGPRAGDSGADAGGEGGPLPAVVRALHDSLRWYVRTAIETPEDDVVAALGNLYLQRQLGARDSVQETEAFGTNLAHGSEVVIAHLGLECVLALGASAEALTDAVVVPAEPGMPSPKLMTRDTAEIRVVSVAGLVCVLWRAVMNVCNTLLARAGHDVLVNILMRGLQGMTYSAGALGLREPRDTLLHALCAHTLLPPGEDDMAAAMALGPPGGAAGPGAGGGVGALPEDRSVGGAARRSSVASVSSVAPSGSSTSALPTLLGQPSNVSTSSAGATPLPPSASASAFPAPFASTSASSAWGASSIGPGFLTGILAERGGAAAVRVVLTPRNIAALKALFALAHRLADVLGGSGWAAVVDAVNALDMVLVSPHTTTASYLLETAGEMEVLGLQPTLSMSLPPGVGQAAVAAAAVALSSGGAAAAMAAAREAGVLAAGVAGTGMAMPTAAAAALAAAVAEGGSDDGATTAQRELRILSSAADQLFENTHHMSPEAVVSLLSALADISSRTLAGMGLPAGPTGGGGAAAAAAVVLDGGAQLGMSSGGAAAAIAAARAAGVLAASAAAAAGGGGGGGTASGEGGPSGGASLTMPAGVAAVRLCALNRMVDTLLHNLWRIQDLWGIFLAHVLEVLESSSPQVRAAALDALDRTITRALSPDLHVPDKFTAPLPPPEDAFSPGTAAAAAAARRSMSNAGSTPVPSPGLSLYPSFAIGPSPLHAASVPIAQGSGLLSGQSPGPGSRRTSRDIGVLGSSGGAQYSGRQSGELPPLAPGMMAAVGSPPPPGLQNTPLRTQLPPGVMLQTVSESPFLNASPGSANSTSAAASPFAQSLSAAAAAAAAGAPPSPAIPPSFTSTYGAQPPTAAVQQPLSYIINRGVQQAAQQEDVQHMLLVALDSLYSERGRTADVRRGLLRVALHVLQHHGEALTRGWVPLLRLLEAVPGRGGVDATEVRLGFQVVELLATDYLASSLPKEHVAKALDVIARFAHQDLVLNVSLTAITMLWNVTDHLARSRGTLSRAANASHAAASQAAAAAAASAAAASSCTAAAANGGALSFSGMSGSSTPAVDIPGRHPSEGGAELGEKEKQMSPAFAAALAFARGVPARPGSSSSTNSPWPDAPATTTASATITATGTAQPGEGTPAPALTGPRRPSGAGMAPLGASPGEAGAPLHDLNEAESIAMLMIAFRALKALSVDPRPEARNAAVRTLYLAVGSHGGKFPLTTWHELFWCLLFELLATIYKQAAASSREEAAAVELGKEKGGRSVVMLVHHSRNSEQKQWDETLVLALGGTAKVVKRHLPLLARLDVWGSAWEELMQVVGSLLASGRKGVAMAATSLLSTVLTEHGARPVVTRAMWDRALEAIDRGVGVMAAPNTPASMQARAELLTCIANLALPLLGLPKPPSLAAFEPPPLSPAFTGSGMFLPPAITLPPPASPAQAAAAATAAGVGLGMSPGGLPASVGPAATQPAPPPDPEHVMLFVRWLDRFARYPVGLDDSSAIHFTTLGPIQRAALAALSAMPPAITSSNTWPAVLGVLCNMMRPYSTLALRAHAQQAAALQAACVVAQRRAGGGMAAPPAPSLSSEPPSGLSSLQSSAEKGPSGPGSRPAVDPLLEARAMSPVWMARIAELAAAWYRDHVTWQVRVATFPLLVGALSECMATRHLGPQLGAQIAAQQQQAAAAAAAVAQLGGGGAGPAAGGAFALVLPDCAPEPLDELWRSATKGFVTVVSTGLPSINICSQGHAQHVQVPHSTWPALARAFTMFLLASGLPHLHQPSVEAQAALAAAAAAAASAGALTPRGGASGRIGEGSVGGGAAAAAAAAAAEAAAADLELTVAVLDCLSDTVLSSCQHAPVHVRRTLVEVLDAGAASAAAPATAGVLPPPAATPGAAAAAALAATVAADRTTPYDESGLPPNSRLSHVCLNKLYVLCSRGQEPPEQEGRETPVARAQLEVAQLALPAFISRCEAVLSDFVREEARGGRAGAGAQPPTAVAAAASAAAPSAAAQAPAAAAGAGAGGVSPPTTPRRQPPPLLTSFPATPPTAAGGGASPASALHDKACHVLELLVQLRVVPAVSDALLPSRPHLRFWLEVSRAVRSGGSAPSPQVAAAAASAPLLSPSLLSRHSSSGVTDGGLAGMAGGAGTGTGEAHGTQHGGGSYAPSVRSETHSISGVGRTSFTAGGPAPPFFNRTYSSTGTLLGGSGGSGGLPGGGGAGPPQQPSPRAGEGSGGGGFVGAGGPADGRPPPPSLSRIISMSGQSTASQPTSSAGQLSAPPVASGSTIATAASVGAGGGHRSLQWTKEQAHLAALYGVLVECVTNPDPAVRSAVQGLLAGLGGGLGLCPSHVQHVRHA
ncbi:hypothetical protein HYH03_001428 [Edaphochlamys debaryana]|uniref:Protein MON2 homolog n=1 Tax=Edaphochlamys debaryana TaxID=47281 RepID=A0A835YFA8_9CHLO|nr:hypothetical protein HYH03_001428 [Edaphochlamys debaryana]|eukprot:KAG2500662.1 hypothetical protein HYH03_001428 [Edaphochlamys debaryana]